ncbi:MAG TPA: DUF72 domain-containing protein [Candidatus Limnocylindrales bacterium]|nr:DUF72 domain-containing protein [Candidatus Limnocylindrales bacterium]
MAGRLRTGTSGFAYPAWSPRFYPPKTRSADLLPFYASRLATVELNNTFYRSPTPAAVDAWLAATPSDFRFAVKAQRSSSFRSLQPEAAESVQWLTTPLRRFGERLGTVLFRVPENVHRDDARLAGLLAAWPRDLPLALEFQDPSWHVDEVFAAAAGAGAAIVATDLETTDDHPVLRRSGPLLYLRLRRPDYSRDELVRWLDRLEPFLSDGVDAYVYFRHDEVGRGAELALELLELARERDFAPPPGP